MYTMHALNKYLVARKVLKSGTNSPGLLYIAQGGTFDSQTLTVTKILVLVAKLQTTFSINLKAVENFEMLKYFCFAVNMINTA